MMLHIISVPVCIYMWCGIYTKLDTRIHTHAYICTQLWSGFDQKQNRRQPKHRTAVWRHCLTTCVRNLISWALFPPTQNSRACMYVCMYVCASLYVHKTWNCKSSLSLQEWARMRAYVCVCTCARVPCSDCIRTNLILVKALFSLNSCVYVCLCVHVRCVRQIFQIMGGRMVFICVRVYRAYIMVLYRQIEVCIYTYIIYTYIHTYIHINTHRTLVYETWSRGGWGACCSSC